SCATAGAIAVTAEVPEGPFALHPSHFELAEGDRATLTVSFVPQHYALEEGRIRIAWDGQSIDVPVGGRADPDQDGDGFDAEEAGGEDCDDADPGVHPGAPEVRDLADQDCDGLVDEGLIRPGDLLLTEIMAVPSSAEGRW